MTLSVTFNLGTDDLVVGKVSAGDTASLTGKLFCLTALVYCPSFIGHTVKADRKLYVAFGSLINRVSPAK